MRIGASDFSAHLSHLGWLGRLVLRRAIADRGLLVPAFVGCLLATTLIASGPILATAIATAGVREELRSAAPTAANLRETATLSDAPRRVRASGSEPAGGDPPA